MAVKYYNIQFPKKNYEIIALSVKENGENVKLGDSDQLYMTVKSSADNEEIKFQKSLGNGITFNEETLKYEIEINSSDTKDFQMNIPYGYDITIYYDGTKPKQKVIGTFIMNDKYTTNEVVI